ncbi:MAG TPA: hypothetical protein PLV89_11700 [Treponemataceae bacterium]|nr:hypothetical protein [Treponemataceae bacterium]
MKFESLLSAFHEHSVFDYNTVSLFFEEENPSSVKTSLYRFMKEGKLESLRRGLYTFADHYCKKQLSAPQIANLLYQPSYLSERWALGWYGIIPEKVVVYTSVSTRPTRSFTNKWGSFTYRTISDSEGKGTITQVISGEKIKIAEKEQALLDFWYLEGGNWSPERMESMRFNPEEISIDRLTFLARSFNSKTINKALADWIMYADSYDEGVHIQ